MKGLAKHRGSKSRIRFDCPSHQHIKVFFLLQFLSLYIYLCHYMEGFQLLKTKKYVADVFRAMDVFSTWLYIS